MTLISYAQNGEDIVLHRALADIENGFYVDIGAFDPSIDSVTKLFYEKGWRGVNVEPVSAFYIKFLSERYNDINLNIAVGATSGMCELSVVDDTGLSTINKAFAQRHEAGGFSVRNTLVPVVTGNDLLSKFGGHEIHFLKVDVEGAEKDVFESIDFSKYRPWIIVAEATEPLSQVRADTEWAHILTAGGYEFVCFDGLNAFYLAAEHQDRRSELAKPPNVFDKFITYSHKKLQDAISIERAEKENCQNSLRDKDLQIDQLKSALSQAEKREELLIGKIENLERDADKFLLEKEELTSNNSSMAHDIANLRLYIDEIAP